ncbi:MAG: hypothetical protein A3H96_05830 [Acidobacteria bacterium RIFCSPLOWO2_02_FULL_67_36]|nr:MAG: hypothetical protein A3H96_05830 [Acidobacteria bacterium RIFCSPLOWO2_02_FULL_67_36]OFW19772.1 MAG: hypothetical protein A3G21_13410 [Acidobacteria bacterium RIFCSPLOWO2_12_FULL_66_21]
MKYRASILAALAVAVTAAAAAVHAQQSAAEALFRQALAAERAEGHTSDAVFKYERLIVDFARDRQVAAKAMYQLALLYERARDPRGTLLLGRLVREYGDVKPFASRASERLAARGKEPRAPFPAVSLDEQYELGSRDGRLVAYHTDPKEWGTVQLKDLMTGAQRQLVSHPGDSVSNLAWSPDGRRVAYNLLTADGKGNEIRVVDVQTGATTGLRERGYPLDWTATGEIFFYRPNYAASGVDYFLMSANGGGPRKIHFDTTCCPAITPDATRLIVSKSKKLFVLDVATSATTPVTRDTGEESRPQVSPDGRLLAFQANPDGRWGVYVAPIDGALPVGATLRLTNIEGPVYAGGNWIGREWWTSDGVLTMRYEYAGIDLYRVEVDPRTARAIDSPQRLTQDADSNWTPSVSPDGSHIAYFYRNGTRYGLAVMDSDGRNERPLIEQNLVLPLKWRSADEILFKRAGAAGQPATVAALNIHTGVLQDVAQFSGNYWWYVPARREVLHLYPNGGGPREAAALKAMSLADRSERVVAQIDYLVPRLAVSPDGHHFAYSTSRPIEGSNERVWELGLMSLDGKAEGTLIPSMRTPIAPMAWSPDGKWLLYGDNAAGLMVLDVQTRESWLLQKEAQPGTWAGWGRADWSPDGRFIVVDRERPARKERLSWSGVTADATARLLQKRPGS